MIWARINAILLTSLALVFSLNISSAATKTWLETALQLQREIDRNAPFQEATFLGTHNSYNSKAYQTALRYIDPNQTLSIYDQLEAGVRSIELDAHWTLATNFAKDILLCHGQANHLGCSIFDRPINEGLRELKEWLQNNPKEIVLLYIERHLDKHEPRLTAMLDDYLGAYIFKPSVIRKMSDTNTCVSLPSQFTKNEILRAGKQLIIVTKDCDGSNPNYEEQDQFTQNWNDYVFAGSGDIPTLPYTFIDATITHFTPSPDCGNSTIFYPDMNHTSLWRIYENRTAIAAGQLEKKLLPEDMKELQRCGINWPTMDMLTSGDLRLSASIWSWAPNFPKEGDGDCAIYEVNEGLKNIPCEQTQPGFACQDEVTREFKALALIGPFRNGEGVCQVFAGKTWHFVVPVNGKQMSLLKQATEALAMKKIWVNYKKNAKGDWIAHSH